MSPNDIISHRLFYCSICNKLLSEEVTASSFSSEVLFAKCSFDSCNIFIGALTTVALVNRSDFIGKHSFAKDDASEEFVLLSFRDYTSQF